MMRATRNPSATNDTHYLRVCMLLMVLAVLVISADFAWADLAIPLKAERSAEVSIDQLFEEVSDIDDCQFVMMDYTASVGDVVYLKVRDEYSSWYASLNSRANDLLAGRSEGADDPDTVFTDHPLMRIQNTRNDPWKDLFLLKGYENLTYHYGTAFLVGETVALTCGHCVTDDEGDFLWHLTAYSSPDVLGSDDWHQEVARAIVPIEWYATPTGVNRWEYDYAVLVFEEAVPGSSETGLFSCDAGAAGLGLNCAGWLDSWGGTDGRFAWRNAYEGSVSSLLSSGNMLAVNLSALPGMSGGPLYRAVDGSYVAVGMISRQSLDSPYCNYATGVTEACEIVVSWAEAGGFQHISSSSSGNGSGLSPFTGPSDDVQLTALQASYQERLQSTGPGGIPAALGRAMAANPDVFGWLYVPGTKTSLPLARREGDGSYYLDHDSLGNPSAIGCAFTAGDAGMSDAVTAVYGHSFAAGDLALTSLHAFEDAAFFAGHERAYVYLPGRRLEYRVVGANLFNARSIEEVGQADSADLGDYFAELSNPDPAAFLGYKRAFSLDPASDRVLQLSTCTVPADPAHRFVVTCAYVGEEEL